MPTPLTDADKVLRNDTGIDIATNIASIASALTPSNITDLGDVNLTNPITDGQVIKYDTATQKWVNGLGNITMECTQAQYDAWKQSGQLKTNTLYVITDAPNLNATAQDISYDGGADTVWDKVEAKANTASLATVATSGLFNDLLSNPFNNNGLISDLNISVRAPGECKINVYNGGATNSPSGSAGGWVFTFTNNGSTAYGSQVAFSNGGLYYRALVSNTYGTWRTIATA